MRLLSRIGARPLVRAFKLTHMFTCATSRVRMRSSAMRSHAVLYVHTCVRVRAVEYKVTAGAEAAATTSTHAMVETRDGKRKRRREEGMKK